MVTRCCCIAKASRMGAGQHPHSGSDEGDPEASILKPEHMLHSCFRILSVSKYQSCTRGKPLQDGFLDADRLKTSRLRDRVRRTHTNLGGFNQELMKFVLWGLAPVLLSSKGQFQTFFVFVICIHFLGEVSPIFKCPVSYKTPLQCTSLWSLRLPA